MKLGSFAAAVVLAVLPLGARAAPIEGAWRADPNPFKSPADVTFHDATFDAHLGAYYYGGDYSVAGASLQFTHVIVIDSSAYPSELRDAKAWRFWRELADTLTSSAQFVIEGDLLTLRGPNGAAHFRRINPAGR